MKVLGIDPGKTTGMAIYNLETLKVEWVMETPNGIKGFKRPFLDSPGDVPLENIACENFTLRSSNKFTANLDGVKIIGWLEGEGWCSTFPEPSTHMTLTRLREKKDSYADSVITQMMRDAGFKIGKGHTRMGLSVAVWYAAKVLNHRPTLELLKPKD